ncbi:uncharacterized protein LOC122851111 [Aphidius gifuensis]|uniref:uncharacterized protein LOC122851111 n=1 Tax=Aphidius gifuensis TaxID=684658 RepID=UPI001CDBC712|nr:uncharacterized protein LOC122851111 [Aphidius gifuensis]
MIRSIHLFRNKKIKGSVENLLKMSTNRISIEKVQQTSDVGAKDQLAKRAKSTILLPIPDKIRIEEVCVQGKEANALDWCDITKFKCESSIESSYDDHLLTQSDYEKILLRYGNSIKELSLSDNCDSSIMPFIGDHCKNLTSLECEFNVDSLNNNANHFVQAFTQLNKLKCIKIKVTDKYSRKTMNLFEIINSLPEEINEIHILAEYWFGPVFWTFEKFKNLQKLNLPGICLDKLILQEIAEITTLVHLNIELSYKHIGFPLFNKLVNLEYIKTWIRSEFEDQIDMERVLSTKVLNTIFDKCKNLKHLDIPCQHYDFAEIPLRKWKNFENLEYLTLRCDEIPVGLANTIVKYCKNLKHLWITQEYHFISAKVVKKLTKLENLESLVIDRKRFELSEKSIIIIANNCKKLKRLEFRYNGYIIPTGVDDDLSSPSVLKELSKLQYLEHLNFEGLNNVDDSTIIAIANNCKNLKSLNIQYCHDITETALDALEKKLPLSP